MPVVCVVTNFLHKLFYGSVWLDFQFMYSYIVIYIFLVLILIMLLITLYLSCQFIFPRYESWGNLHSSELMWLECLKVL